MGGDQAPGAVVQGSLDAARALSDAHILLVGDQAVVEPLLRAAGPLPANLEVRHASQVVSMDDSPGVAIRQKSDSSIVVGTKLVRDGAAQAVVSAGNSGAMMAAGMLILKAQRGVDRPAIGSVYPTRAGLAVLVDAGATADCKPAHLVQFARMGSVYAATMLDRPNPRVGLLSIGEEPTKGDELTKETHKLLRTLPELNFIGNVEPKEVMRGEVDVIVCDGFVGNLLLKAGEAVGTTVMQLITDEVSKHWFHKLLAGLLRPAFRNVKKRFDYAEVGGALLLGVNGIVVIGHGRSNSLAIANAIRVAYRAVQRHLSETLLAAGAETPAPATE